MLYFIKLLKSISHKIGKYQLLNNIYRIGLVLQTKINDNKMKVSGFSSIQFIIHLHFFTSVV